MRGKRPTRSLSAKPTRIIPAHAGQTIELVAQSGRSADHPRACGANRLISVAAACRADHPRACGANWIMMSMLLWIVGSSPRMRGKLRVVVLAGLVERIIPAHAGQTDGHGVEPWSRSDHPRACGATDHGRFEVAHRAGSSPRMRGKHLGCLARRPSLRIIPAHAGQTIVPQCPRTMCPDHPRACGANHGH